MKALLNFINNKLSNYLIRKTYESEMNNFRDRNQQQMELLFANNGIDL